MNDARTILYFDGICNLCNKTVQFVLKHDKKKEVLFATLQSMKPAPKEPETVVLIYRGNYYYKSDVVLKLFKIFGGAWSLLLVGYIVPKPVRNKLYDIVARHRYKWFGKTDHCMVPASDISERFLSQ
jgi:predicted DCC family thiol-disulfide oxidoreductase YuxK